ncbi:MAG: nucleoside phosphorylase [Desulfobacteraceae bacterium]|nr:nucleoside phosphorylase [Desulfobacteraceae bacterium]MBC2755229.1 nucleoside phosphorylase [Desulfobacteraceae bacterium]
MIEKKLHHLGLSPSDVKCAIITGDPRRVEIITSLLEGSERLSDRRGFLCYRAYIGKLPIVVVSTGIGGPSTAIVVEELVEIGIRIIIRIGTCGALQSNIKVGDLIIPTGCVREEGTTAQYIEPIFPAVPDFEMLKRLFNAATNQQGRFHIGITHCKDAYYLEQPGKQLAPQAIENKWKLWQQSGVLATEMESSTLFVLGSLRKIRTGSVFINIGKVTEKKIFQRSLENAVKIVSYAITSLVRELGVVHDTDNLKKDDSSYLDVPGN